MSRAVSVFTDHDRNAWASLVAVGRVNRDPSRSTRLFQFHCGFPPVLRLDALWVTLFETIGKRERLTHEDIAPDRQGLPVTDGYVYESITDHGRVIRRDSEHAHLVSLFRASDRISAP